MNANFWKAGGSRITNVTLRLQRRRNRLTRTTDSTTTDPTKTDAITTDPTITDTIKNNRSSKNRSNDNRSNNNEFRKFFGFLGNLWDSIIGSDMPSALGLVFISTSLGTQ